MNNSRRRSLILILGSLAALGPMSIDLYLPAFPLLETEFGATSGGISATMGSYFLGIAFGQLFYGPVSDAYGRRSPLLGGLLLYMAGALACALSPSVHTLIAFRLLQALGGCAGMVICRAVVRDLFPPHQMAGVFSSLLLVMGLAPVLAPTVGAVLVKELGWRALFMVMAGFSGFCLWGAMKVIPRTRERKPLSLGETARTFAALLKHRRFMSFTTSATLVRCGLFGYITGSPFLFQNHYGLSGREFGLLFGLNAACFVAASQFNSRLVKSRGYGGLCRAVLAATTVATLPLLIIGLTGDGPFLLVEGALLIFVASIGLSLPVTSAGGLEDQPENAGSASALMGLLGSLGGAVAALSVGHLQEFTDMALPLMVSLSCLAAWLAFVWLHPEEP